MAPLGFTARTRVAAALLAFAAAGEASEAALAFEYALALERDDACVLGGPSCSLALSQLRASARGGRSASLARPISPHVLETADADLALLANGVPATNIAAQMARESLEFAISGPDKELPWAVEAAHEAEKNVVDDEAQTQVKLQPPAQAGPHVQSDVVPIDTALAAQPSVQQNMSPAMPQATHEEDSDDGGQNELDQRFLHSDMFIRKELITLCGEHVGKMLWGALNQENLQLDDETKKKVIDMAGQDGGCDWLIGYVGSNFPAQLLSETSNKALGGGSKVTQANFHDSGTSHSRGRSHSKALQSHGKAHKIEDGTKRHAHSRVPVEAAARASTERSYTTKAGGLEIVVMGDPGNTKHHSHSRAHGSNFT